MSLGEKVNLLEQYKVKDLLWASITKTNLKQNAGLHLMTDEEGVIRVKKIDGAFEMFTDVKPGDRLLEFQEKDVSSYSGGITEIEELIQSSLKVQVRVLRYSAEIPPEEASDIDDDASPMEIHVGDTLVVYGTKGDLDGKLVTIKRESTKKGRWLVEVQDTGKKTIVNDKNLFPPDSMKAMD